MPNLKWRIYPTHRVAFYQGWMIVQDPEFGIYYLYLPAMILTTRTSSATWTPSPAFTTTNGMPTTCRRPSILLTATGRMKMIELQIGQVYTNRNGSQYKVIGTTIAGTIMQRISDGWTLVAHGIVQCPDGTIEWDFSTHGHWPEEDLPW